MQTHRRSNTGQVNWGVIGARGIAMLPTLPGAVKKAKSAVVLALTDVRLEAVIERGPPGRGSS
jgi:hypothetical protein